MWGLTLRGHLHVAYTMLDSGKLSINTQECSMWNIWLTQKMWLFGCPKIKVLPYFKNLRIKFKFLVLLSVATCTVGKSTIPQVTTPGLCVWLCDHTGDCPTSFLKKSKDPSGPYKLWTLPSSICAVRHVTRRSWPAWGHICSRWSVELCFAPCTSRDTWIAAPWALR